MPAPSATHADWITSQMPGQRRPRSKANLIPRHAPVKLTPKRSATAREITDAINAIEPVAHSTVQTMLRILEDKKAVGHKKEGRTFVFVPLVDEHNFKRGATQNLIEGLFG